MDINDTKNNRVTHPKVFISYSWASKEKACSLTDRLISDGVDVVIDVYDLKEGMDKYAFMQKIVNDTSIEKVLICCDKSYMDKANNFKGGVGNEAMIISPEIYKEIDQQKFIPIIFERENGEPCLPTFAKSRIYIDFTDSKKEKESYEQLVRNLWNEPDKRKPKLGSKPLWLNSTSTNTLTLQDQVRLLDDSVHINPDVPSILHGAAFEFTKTLNSIMLNGEENNDLMCAIKNTESIRNCFIDFVEKLIRINDVSTEQLGDLIENIYNGVVCFEAKSRECFLFFFWDIFICTTAILLGYEKYAALNKLLNRTYFLRNIIGTNNDPTAYTFSHFRASFHNLEEEYKPQIEPRLISLAADILTKREYGLCITKNNLVAADITLAHLAMLYGKADFPWYPILTPYSDCAGCNLIWEKLPSMAFCHKLFPLFDVSSFEAFKEKIRLMHNQWKADDKGFKFYAFMGGARQILSDKDFERMGTLP